MKLLQEMYLELLQETDLIEHSIMLPPDHQGGKLSNLVSEGDYDLETVTGYY